MMSPTKVGSEETPYGFGLGLAKVRGRSNLPSSLHVSCELRFDKGRVAGSVSPGEIQDGVWETEIYFDPGGPFFAGAYRIVSSFSMLLENSATLDGLDDSILKRFENRSEVVGECEVFLGLRAEAEAEDRAVQEYFGKLRSDVIRLDKTLRSRLRDFRSLSQSEDAIRSYAKVANRVGVTTVTDLYSQMEDSDADSMVRITGEDAFPLRIVPVLGAAGGDPAQVAARAKTLASRSTDKLRLGAVKLMTDGSIQGWTARVKWPGYVGGQPNGLWNMAPDQIAAFCDTLTGAGVQMHIHVNGDEASEVVIDAIDAALRKHPWRGHRHVLQHGQMMGPDQFRRCAELGLTVNLFANHLWYFGDQHVALTIGRDRAQRMDACRAALDAGVPLAIHSDAPVTPMGPLFTAWCAVNRQSMSGQTLGQAQAITVDEALRAITLGAAYTLKMDNEIGSIEAGKRADFAILGDDPTVVAASDLKDVPVLGTVLGGRCHLT